MVTGYNCSYLDFVRQSGEMTFLSYARKEYG